MLARATAATPWGIDARPVHVEVDIRHGLPQMQMVGLPDAAVRESRERVRAAIKNCGFELPPRAVVINLAPADLRKAGNHLDLAIALAMLAAYGHLEGDRLDRRLLVGELALDGSLRPVRGGLAIADLGRRTGAKELLLPHSNAGEAAAIDGPAVIPVADLGQAMAHLRGAATIGASRAAGTAPVPDDSPPDLTEVRGQEGAKRALEVAAAGGHNLLFIGPPGSGKTMLARRMPGILPPLTHAESVSVTRILSLAAAEPPPGLVSRRPFRAPHSSVSIAGMAGGGAIPRPGEVTLAHCGVLFLDELPEFRRDSLEALRQPLEEGEITVVRSSGRFSFPARFSLLAAMNPCRCGHLGDPRRECRCSPGEIARYRRRVSGPLLDRIDLHIEVPAVSLEELRAHPGESSSAVVERVLAARRRQSDRFPGEETPVNAAMSSAALRRHCRLHGAVRALLDRAFERLGLSARALTRILKVARTIADLEQNQEIRESHVAEAIQYRSLDRDEPR
jgi:magnesium chelatase family protein